MGLAYWLARSRSDCFNLRPNWTHRDEILDVWEWPHKVGEEEPVAYSLQRSRFPRHGFPPLQH
jgi:hypothetical protein